MKKNQEGMAFISWLIIIIVFGFFLTIFLKLLPIYIQDYAIKSAFEKVARNPEIKEQFPEQIRDTFIKYLTVNSITAITADKLIIEEKHNKRSLILNYEIRKNLVANIDLVVFFNYQESI